MYRSKLIFLLPWWRSEYYFLQRPRYDDNVEVTLGFTSTTNLLWTSLSSQILLEELSRPRARRSTIELLDYFRGCEHGIREVQTLQLLSYYSCLFVCSILQYIEPHLRHIFSNHCRYSVHSSYRNIELYK